MRFPKEIIQPFIFINPCILLKDYSGIPSPFRHTYMEFLCAQETDSQPCVTFLARTPQVCLSHIKGDGSGPMVTELFEGGHAPLCIPLVPGHWYRCILPMYGNLVRLKETSPYPAWGNMLWFYSRFHVLSPRPDIRHILDTITETCGACTLPELADSLMCSERHLRRVFTEIMHTSPKEYCRFVRLQEALSEMIQNPGFPISYYIRNLTYADQAHFQREFREFTGITPGAFLKAYTSRKSAST